jgi:hypothetical protein
MLLIEIRIPANLCWGIALLSRAQPLSYDAHASLFELKRILPAAQPNDLDLNHAPAHQLPVTNVNQPYLSHPHSQFLISSSRLRVISESQWWILIVLDCNSCSAQLFSVHLGSLHKKLGWGRGSTIHLGKPLPLTGSADMAARGGESGLRSTSQGDAWQREHGEQAVNVLWDFQTG